MDENFDNNSENNGLENNTAAPEGNADNIHQAENVHHEESTNQAENVHHEENANQAENVHREEYANKAENIHHGENANQAQGIHHADNAPHDNDNIISFTMDKSGKISAGSGGSAAVLTNSKTYIILGWISAALTAFVSPYFAIAGIVFGVLANKQARGSGNAVIITNVVLAAINIMFGLFLLTALRRMFMGF